MITVADVVVDAAMRLNRVHIRSPLLNAHLLLAHVVGRPREDLIAHPGRKVTDAQLWEFEAVLAKREAREPLAYILGHKEFHGIEIEVAPGVLIPRPETELLVEECIRCLHERGPVPAGGLRAFRSPRIHSGVGPTIADIGAGSGAIAIALAVSLPQATVRATETSHAALEVARRNVEKHNLAGRVKLLQGDLVDPLANMQFDAMVSNPPYIPSGEIASLQPEVRHEPVEALDGGPDGLAVYRRLLPAARPLLVDGGFIAVEVGAGRSGAVREIARAAGYSQIETARDLAGIERVVVAYR